MKDRGRGRGPVRIDGVIGTTLDGASPASGRLLKILERFRQLVSETTLAHARPTSIRRDVLTLTVTEPVWKSELSYFVPEFMTAINGALPEKDRIREIRIRVGPLAEPASEPPPPRRAPPPVDLGEVPARLRARIESVQDPELRELMSRVVTGTGKKRNRGG